MNILKLLAMAFRIIKTSVDMVSQDLAYDVLPCLSRALCPAGMPAKGLHAQGQVLPWVSNH